MLGNDLHLDLGTGGSRRAALITALREAVREGRLAPGTLLPPYRSLAADLGIARNTVADAYAELVAEGWLTSARVPAPGSPTASPRPPRDPCARPRRHRSRTTSSRAGPTPAPSRAGPGWRRPGGP
ncbi:hypothetical protein STANM309S_05896 [Streptomyces tanashiensis]